MRRREAEAPQTSYLLSWSGFTLSVWPNLKSYLQSDADSLMMHFSYSCSALLMAAAQTQICSSGLSVVLCHLWQHHQPFVSAQVPPPDGSIMKLQHERGRLSVKTADTSGVCSKRVFQELRITTASGFVSAFYEHLHTRQSTHPVSHCLLNVF